jgi:LysR family transcriptional regulator for metE and metH
MIRLLRETGSISEAAKYLHLTQSALSHQLKNLENYFDVRLFVRKTRPVRFTLAGQQLLALADAILPQVKRTEQQLNQLAKGEQGRLHIAIECHNCFEWLMPTLDRYRHQWPEVEMDLSLGFSFEPLTALRRGDVDIVITSDPQVLTGITYHPLFDYQLVLIMANTHLLTQKAWIEPSDLKSETLLIYPVAFSRLDIFKHFLEPAHITPADMRMVELTLMTVQLAASGRGVAALPNWVVTDYLNHRYITARPLGQQGLWRTLYMALYKEQQHLPFMRDFLATACRVSFETLRGIRHSGAV